jgi:hypothetical protein
LCSTPIPKIVCCDFGAKHKQNLDAFLAQYSIKLEASQPYHKGSTTLAESTINIVKAALRRLQVADPSDWSTNIPLLCAGINQTFLYNKASRNSLFYSPLLFANKLNILQLDFPEHLFDNQLQGIQHIIKKRKERKMKNLNKRTCKIL